MACFSSAGTQDRNFAFIPQRFCVRRRSELTTFYTTRFPIQRPCGRTCTEYRVEPNMTKYRPSDFATVSSIQHVLYSCVAFPNQDRIPEILLRDVKIHEKYSARDFSPVCLWHYHQCYAIRSTRKHSSLYLHTHQGLH